VLKMIDEICPNCGSLDVMEDFTEPHILVCLDCNTKFPAKDRNTEEVEDNDDEQENSDLEEIEEEWIR
jgi:DNA-directed RNA polymerase subunit M/transcription elongation factor TFIIS